MEQLTIRDWMVIAGAAMILAVLVDAARRVWRERRAEVRLNAKITRADDEERAEDAFNLLAELPNGGARIVARDDLQPVATPLSPEELEDPAIEPPDLDEGVSAPASEQAESGIELDAAVEKVETTQTAEVDTSPELSMSAPPREQANATRRRGRSKRAEPENTDPDAPETLDWLEELDSSASKPTAREAKLPREVDPHVFVLNVVSRSNDGFWGSDVLQILLACDLRFGDMDFFHRHESASGRGPIQFSVANMMNPGVFDIDAMDQLHTRGLMFFVTLPGPENMLQAFDYMYETAMTVAKNLDGDVLDETRSAITRQSLEHMRQQIREFERRLMLEQER